MRRFFRPPNRPGWGVLALTAGAGLVAALGQAPLSWPLIALVGFVGLLASFKLSTTPAQAAWIGWAGGTGYFALSLFWIVEPFLVDIPRHGWMAPFALILMAGGLSLLWAVAFGVARKIGGLVALVVSLTLMEMLRAHLFTGFPWATIGHIWIDHGIGQLAAWGGTPLLTVITLGFAALLASQKFMNFGVFFAVFLAALAFGEYRLSSDATMSAKTVRLVQPNAPQHEKWDPEKVPMFLERALDLTAQPGTPDLVVWPETSIAYPLDASPNTLASVAAAARGKPVIVGGNDRKDGRWFNAMLLLNPDGSRAETYHKHHLVPFGEYIPLGEIFGALGMTQLSSQGGGGFSAGPGPRLIDIPGIGTALPMICYELIFPRHFRATERPDVILQITNDAWFGEISGPYQHLAQAQLRAIEQGLPLIRAANTGVSAVIDPYGRITAQTQLGEAAALDAPMPQAIAETNYAKLGDGPIGLGLGLILLGLGVTSRRNRIDAPLSGR